MPYRLKNRPGLQSAVTFASPILMAGLGIFAFFAIRGEERATQRVADMNATTTAYRQLLLDIRDMQSSVRSFIITETVNDYGRYAAARSEALRDVEFLRTKPGADATRRWLELHRLVSAKLQITDSIVAAQLAGNSRTARRIISSSSDIALLKQIEQLLADAIEAEKIPLEKTLHERRRYVTLLTVFVPLGTLLVAIIAVALNRALARYAEQEAAQHRIADELNEKLSTREARFRALIENAHDIIAIVNNDLRLTYVSPSVTRVLGYTPTELVGKSGIIGVHPDDLVSIENRAVTAKATPGELVTGTMRLRRKDGEWRVLEYAAINMLDNPAVEGMVYNARDITEEQRLQAQLLQSQKMEAVGRLAGGIAHDFNNLITTIKGNLSFALKGLEPAHPAHADLEEVDRAAERASTLTRQLLAFSRKQVLEPRVVDCRAVVEQFQRMISRVIGENIVFQTRLAEEPQPIRVDPGQLEQVLMNLVVNARDAMPNGGTVTVEVSREFRDVPWPGEENFRPGNHVVLTVSDTGTGMSPEVQAHIFEPFYTTKASGQGTGLGLAMVYGIVKQSGGYLNVYSEAGVGTTFRIYFPLVEASAGEPKQGIGEAVADARGSERILVVEDEPAVRALACRALRKQGYDVIEASNGMDALQHLDAQDGIDLMISDLVMPGMHGLELCRLAKQKRPGLRILLMSGYSDADIGGLDPEVSWLEKPFTIDVLARKARAVLDNT